MSDLPSHLTAALGQTYRIERELGGGGMSRVFLAEEVELGRRVVIKVLPPEMAAGVNTERFRREIQLAAKLQHPHIVPLHAAGAAGDLLYYVMPFIEGESLRAKLSRQGELPIPDAVRVLRDVVDAVAYAHRHGLVHRDIKPDNVLLSENHALVTDFGVAKAVTESASTHSLTSVGVALGTPAYMAPEQATADPQMDHRADIYAIGALAYEMLAGRPPFVGSNAQSILAAHIADTPDPVTRHRASVPAPLAALVMRCLEKKPADRWQRAAELLAGLEDMLGSVTSGAATPAGTTMARAEPHHPLRVAGMFAGASVLVLLIVYAAVRLLGLPDWVVLGAMILLAIGLPIMVVTGVHERRRAAAPGHVPTPTGVTRHFTWRKALLGGGVAFAGLGILTTMYMAMRALGVGPVGTLVAAGVIDRRDPLIVADFANRTADSGLGPSITDAFRIDLAQSPMVRVLDGTAVADALARLNRGRVASLDSALAQEVAQREGIKAIVSGEIGTLGRGYALSARVISSADGRTLVAVRETADDDAEIIAAVDRLSKKMRERIGESLRSIRAADPLVRVTTGSLEALRKYTQAERASGQGDYDRSIPLLREAIALDSTFAMAYRKLAVDLSNSGRSRSETMEAARRALQYRDRLPPRERYLTQAFYYTAAEPNREQVMAAYRAALEVAPEDHAALNNLALTLLEAHRYAEAEPLAIRATRVDDHVAHYDNALWALVTQGKFAAAESLLTRFMTRRPDDSNAPFWRGMLARARLDHGTAIAVYDSVRLGSPIPDLRRRASYHLATIAARQGRTAAAERHFSEMLAAYQDPSLAGTALTDALDLTGIALRLRDSRAAALRSIEAALARYPLREMPALDRPYLRLAMAYAEAGRPDRARAMHAEWQREVDEQFRREDPYRHGAAAAIAEAEDRLEDAVASWRAYTLDGCVWTDLCGLFELARAFDAAGQTDSAVASYAALTDRSVWHVDVPSSAALGAALKRLGELFEQRGDRARAVEYYSRFVELWKDADPGLQPVVREVRLRLGRLTGEPQ
ncbi:MAG TPA: protein kinase [Gemmatimonadales bacterium]|nr:protein kinase [Gemmatimonadales bacterium]